jgi:hypothetical protein
MTNVQAAEILRDIGEALQEGSTLRIRAVKATMRALAMAVVALEGEPGNPYAEREVVDAVLEPKED